jgi:hypothetical protein
MQAQFQYSLFDCLYGTSLGDKVISTPTYCSAIELCGYTACPSDFYSQTPDWKKQQAASEGKKHLKTATTSDLENYFMCP